MTTLSAKEQRSRFGPVPRRTRTFMVSSHDLLCAVVVVPPRATLWSRTEAMEEHSSASPKEAVLYPCFPKTAWFICFLQSCLDYASLSHWPLWYDPAWLPFSPPAFLWSILYSVTRVKFVQHKSDCVTVVSTMALPTLSCVLPLPLHTGELPY